MTTVRITLRAFIPDQVFNSSKQPTTYSKEALGQTVLPFAAWAPRGVFSDYVTDGRGFSAEAGASARLSSTIVIDLNDANEIKSIKIERKCCSTKMLSGKPYQALFFAKPCEEAVAVPKGKERIEMSQNQAEVVFLTSGKNPFFELLRDFNYAPAIVMAGKLKLKVSSGGIRLAFAGKHTQFPAFEAMIQIGENEPLPLYQVSPEPGKTPFDLMSGATVKFSVGGQFLLNGVVAAASTDGEPVTQFQSKI